MSELKPIREVIKIPTVKIIIGDDEQEKDGLPYCKKCGEPRFFKRDDGNGHDIVVRALCSCQEAEFAQQLEEERKQRRKANFEKRQKLSMIGEKYLGARFRNAVITKNNIEAYNSARAFVKGAETVKAHNIGLFVYGDNSSGKTYLAACICNTLVGKGYSCLFTSIPKLLAETERGYRNDRISQAEIVDTVATKDFVFIDDLGKEFLGDRNTYTYQKAERLLLEILNARYANGLPTVFTSNYQLTDFATKFRLDKAICERLQEMATRTIKLTGDNFRALALEEKANIAKELGI